MKCSVAVCQRAALERGMCHAHAEWARRNGATPTHRIYSDIPWDERFWARTSPGDNGCILWTASTGSEGRYGICSYQGRVHPAHVVAYLVFVGEYDRSLDVDHLCGVTLCVNPGHLEPVTHRENVLRGRSLQAQNARKTHCIRGHEFTPENTIIQNGGCRACRTCVNVAQKRNRLKRLAASS